MPDREKGSHSIGFLPDLIHFTFGLKGNKLIILQRPERFTWRVFRFCMDNMISGTVFPLDSHILNPSQSSLMSGSVYRACPQPLFNYFLSILLHKMFLGVNLWVLVSSPKNQLQCAM